MQPVRIGLLGLGTVGAGTVNVLTRNGAEIARRAGREIRVVHAAARDIGRRRLCPMDGIRLTADPFEVVDDPQIDVVVELIGGDDPARRLVMRAIDNSKHVVTANKALIAAHGNEIFAAARKNGVMVAFEAAVAGGIPIIKTIREGLAGNRIEWLAGIINGTGNFILTEMRDHGREFSDVLAEAQRLGYAEADPAFDVEGIDAAHKLTILSAIAFGIPLQLDKAYTEGITRITRSDVSYAEQLGYRIKHLGIARRTSRGVELRVHPTLIPERRLIASVDGVMNAILVKGDAVGATMYYGAGAGAEPPASGGVGDNVDVVGPRTPAATHPGAQLGVEPDQLSDVAILPMEEVETACYLRMQAKDQLGVLADVTRILADLGISIEAIIQKEPAAGANEVPVILLTHRVLERNMNQAIARIEALGSINGKVMRIRVEHLNRDWK